jgi:cytoskeletal protein CcmA (bactofilin family)
MKASFRNLLYRVRETKPNKEVSVIGSDLRIEGNLKSRGEVYINGTIQGDVTAMKIVVGKNGMVTGKIRNNAEKK